MSLPELLKEELGLLREKFAQYPPVESDLCGGNCGKHFVN